MPLVIGLGTIIIFAVILIEILIIHFIYRKIKGNYE
jgi:hypothetical protein